MKRRHLWSLLAVIVLTLGTLSIAVSQTQGVSNARFSQLTRGINLSHWFAQTELTTDNFQNHFSAEDMRQIKTMGFKHVRLPLDPEVLFDDEHPERLNAENLDYFDRALDLILAQKLAVIVDLHPQRDFKQRLYQQEAFVKDVAQFWRSLAQHLRTRSPEQVFLEVLNEPATKDPQDWYTIQQKLLAAMRRGAPAHTLIASANQRVEDDWNSIEALEKLNPVDDPNVVYNFHFYEPKSFTHQGAEWIGQGFQHFRAVPYPSSPRALAAILPEVRSNEARRSLQRYGEARWDAQRLEERIRRATTWANEHRVRLTCNEFGVYRQFAPAESRLAWLRDVRSVLEKYRIGWAMWDYKSGFGIMVKRDGKSVPDQNLVRVLFNTR